MNKFIKKQLEKTKVILPQYDDTSTEIFIKKNDGTAKSSELELGHYYLAYFEDYIINEPENFTLSSNWNNGTKPRENKVYVRIQQLMGKMVRVYSTSLDSGYIWEGWVPRKGLNILEEVESNV